MFSVGRGHPSPRTSSADSARARLRLGVLAISVCLGVVALANFVAAAAAGLRWSVLTQAIVFGTITTAPLHYRQLRHHGELRTVGGHFVVCMVATYLALCVLARTATVPAHEIATVTVAAYAEELTFRLALPGFLGRQLSPLAHGALLSVLLAQLTFAAAHVPVLGYPGATATDWIYLSANGLLLCVIARYSGLSLAGTTHSLFNATGSMDLPHLPSQRTMQWAIVVAALASYRRRLGGRVFRSKCDRPGW